MTDELLTYYQRELEYLRKMGAEFADAHPKLAGRLRMSAEAVEDPHVSRLIESVAFLNARVRRKLDDDFPELTDALLSILYPHFLAPIPSMSIVQFVCDRDLTSDYALPRGTSIESEPVEGEPCRFRTVYPTRTWPLEVSSATLQATPFDAPRTPRSHQALGCLRIVVSPRAEQLSIAALAPESLCFYLGAAPNVAYELYELLCNDVVEIAVASSPQDATPQVLPAAALRPLGFDLDEGMLPYGGRSFPGYRLLTEFFAFPEKFLFVELTGFDPEKLSHLGAKLELHLFVRRTTPDLEQGVDRRAFQIGCTPVVNLFDKRAEPVQLTRATSEVHVVPDARRPHSMEVYSIDRVTASSPQGAEMRFSPIYGIDHELEDIGGHAYHLAARKPAPPSKGRKDPGTEVWLSLVDLAFQAEAPADWILDVETTCLNRNLPNRLPYGGGHPQLSFSEGGGPIEQIRCLRPFTRTLRPHLGVGARWKLVSHLALNHLSISGSEARGALKEILRLYEMTRTAESRGFIDGLMKLESRPAVMRTMSGGQPGFCRGTEVRITLDESRYSGSGAFLFASILERFLALYGTANSFSQTVFLSNAREGEVKRWPPRAGDVPLR